MAKAAFGWSDAGSWDEYARLSGDNAQDVFSADSASCFVDSPVPVALCGVEGLIVVVRDGTDGRPPAILIAKKGESQRVKEITALIEASGRQTLL
jgi:mannose-1-phosphate guanylyltransferase